VKSSLSKFALFILALIGYLMWYSVPALAQAAAVPAAPAAKAAPQSGKAPKRTSVDFEDQLVQGEVRKPELFYLLQKKQFNFGKLIKLRENFIPEMEKNSEDIEKAK
jgi:hypothetical protein